MEGSKLHQVVGERLDTDGGIYDGDALEELTDLLDLLRDHGWSGSITADAALRALLANPKEEDLWEPAHHLGAEMDRALFLAEHLFKMVPQETWREQGGDDGQGHFEGEFYAEDMQRELAGLRKLVGAHDPLADEVPRFLCEWITRDHRVAGKWSVRMHDLVDDQRTPEEAATTFVLYAMRHQEPDSDRIRVRVSRLVELASPVVERTFDAKVVD